MNFGDKLNKMKKTTQQKNPIIKEEKRVYKDKIYTFLVKDGDDVAMVEQLIEQSNMTTAEFMRNAIQTTYNVQFKGNYKNVGRRGK